MEEEIMKKVKLKIAIAEIKKEEIMNRKRKFIYQKIGIAVCACFVLMTGVVFAKDIEQYIKNIFNNTNEAIDMAVENGYVQSEKMDYVYDKEVGIRVENLVLDNLNLNLAFQFETQKEKVKSIRFHDFTIKNEQQKVIYQSEFKYAKTLEELPLYNSINWMNEPIKLTDTTFADSILFGLRPAEEFEKLYFDIKSLDITYENSAKEVLEGTWKFDITICEAMRKSMNISYTLAEKSEYVESCTGTLSPTGMVLELKLVSSFNISEYLEENFNVSDDLNLFSIKCNGKEYGLSSFVYNHANQIKIHYDNIGTFFDDLDELELYLKPFCSSVILTKQES